MMITIVWTNKVFEETAIGICDALFISGVDSEVVEYHRGYVFGDFLYIMLGLHRFSQDLPKNFVAVQGEQLCSKWFNPSYLSVLSKARRVWEFSYRNRDYLNSKGILCDYTGTRVPLDVFYPNSLSMRIHFCPRSKDVDVLFYGARCSRRTSLEERLKKSGLITEFRYYDLFREEREELISRAKVVLNIHYWPSSSLETHRVEYLCSRGKCVLSEKSSDDALDDVFSDGVFFCSLEDMVNKSRYFVEDEGARQSQELRAQRLSYDRQMDTSAVMRSLETII